MKRRYLRVSVAMLLVVLFAFSAMAAAQVGSTAVFRRRFHAPFASLSITASFSFDFILPWINPAA